MTILSLPNMRASFNSLNDKHLTRFGLSLCFTSLFAVHAVAGPQEYVTPDPMEDKYSQEIREEFAKCREKQNPMAQFWCTCLILETQCEAPRRLEHGDWNTVEFWPSDDPAEREVQFILFNDLDVTGEFALWDKGVVLTCVKGVSELNVFVGDDIDVDTNPDAVIDDVPLAVAFEEGEGYITMVFENAKEVYKSIREGKFLSVTYSDMEGAQATIDFDLFGFDTVTKGWEKLCEAPIS